MGGCLSHDLNDESLPSAETARVISMSGELHEYNVPIRVSEVLESEGFSSTSSSSSSASGFVCNSDSLCYEENILVLPSEEELIQNQIYFMLPRSKLQRPLTASDMAALAVKASVAMQKAAKKGGRMRRRTQISPVLVVNNPRRGGDEMVKDELNLAKRIDDAIATTLPRSESVRRLQRHSSRKFKKAVRSFRIKLSTIEEGIVM